MKEELKEQIERLHEDLQYMEWLDLDAIDEGGEERIAEAYTAGEPIRKVRAG